MEKLLVTADAHRQGNETHFSPHKFYIEVYQYESSEGFTKTLGYLSASKYPSFDDTDKIDVISHEIVQIKKYLDFFE